MSPLLYTAPVSVNEVSSTSMTVQLATPTKVAEAFILMPPEPPALVADLVSGLGSGMPLDRPKDMLRLAEEVLAGPSGFPDGWARTMAEESSRFND